MANFRIMFLITAALCFYISKRMWTRRSGRGSSADTEDRFDQIGGCVDDEGGSGDGEGGHHDNNDFYDEWSSTKIEDRLDEFGRVDDDKDGIDIDGRCVWDDHDDFNTETYSESKQELRLTLKKKVNTDSDPAGNFVNASLKLIHRHLERKKSRNRNIEVKKAEDHDGKGTEEIKDVAETAEDLTLKKDVTVTLDYVVRKLLLLEGSEENISNILCEEEKATSDESSSSTSDEEKVAPADQDTRPISEEKVTLVDKGVPKKKKKVRFSDEKPRRKRFKRVRKFFKNLSCVKKEEADKW